MTLLVLLYFNRLFTLGKLLIKSHDYSFTYCHLFSLFLVRFTFQAYCTRVQWKENQGPVLVSLLKIPQICFSYLHKLWTSVITKQDQLLQFTPFLCGAWKYVKIKTKTKLNLCTIKAMLIIGFQYNANY